MSAAPLNRDTPYILDGLAQRLAALSVRDREVPRYTSYPTAPHFHAKDDDNQWRAWLASVPEETPLSLYLHIPFCRTMCWYCGCATQVAKGDDSVKQYVDSLLAEVALVAQYLPANARVGQIHWGGGTPTIVGASGLRRITDRLAALFSIDSEIEIAIEIDPRRFEAGHAQGFADCGVNRASLGVQSFDPIVQRAINRIQPLNQVQRSLDLLRDAGIKSVNFDLLYGLPHQTEESLDTTVREALRLKPDRLALFGYAHVPWMRAHQKRIDSAVLPGSDLRIRQFLLAEAGINQAGYASIGLDHFARSDDPLAIAARNGNLHRNFQGYTTDSASTLIGFGASAISQLPQGYAANLRAAPLWRRKVSAGSLPVERMRALTTADRMRGRVIENLMCNLKVDVIAIADQFGLDARPLLDNLLALQPIAAAGFLTIEEGFVAVHPEGRLLLRQICSAFDSYQPGMVPAQVA